MSFVHLRLHTEYSLSDGLVRIEAPAGHRGGRTQALAARAAELNLPACAVTDRDNLFAMVKFYKSAEAAGLKPIIGSDVYLAPLRDGDAPETLTLLVQNETGYRNLTRLISKGYLEGQGRGQPLIERDWLAQAHAGLIALSGRESEIARALLSGKLDRARDELRWWRELLGNRFYLEISRCGREGEEDHLRLSCALARAEGVPVVATNDVRFLAREDFDAHEARVCINQSRVLDDPRRPHDYSEEQYLKSAEQMRALFADLPEAVENTLEIARRCTLTLRFGTYHLPRFPVDEGQTVADHLRAEARGGLSRRLAQHPPDQPEEAYRKRLEYELDIIEKMGFPGYFLVVADFIRWSKNNGVPVGPGRGSGAGSLVAYSIGITDLDPLRYGLIFERFLNPERVSMPDFDVDFCMEGRDRVIAYVAQRYGREYVGQIITYGSMAARAVVRDVARVLGHPYGVGDRIAKMIPGQPTFKGEAAAQGCSALEFALKTMPELKLAYDDDDEVHEVLDLGMQLEDITRGVGKHAGGVVIAPEPLTEYAPLYCEPGGAGLVTQFDMKDVETIGLVKFDFLGLRTLTIVQSAVDQINARYPDLKLEILNLPLDDPETYALYASGHTTAVFQMESQGMQRASVDLRPDCFEDIIALISLYRPGPMDLIPEYVARKRGKQPEYLHLDMEPVLRPTHGIFVYQEQVMQIAQQLAGYTLGAADLLRRAMGKKKPEEMAKQRDIFVAGAAERDIDAKTANAIFDLMEKFAGYGFNKSHAAAYALVSYQTAWLKRHYPAEFMAAVLSAEMNHTDSVVIMLDECQRMQLTVLPPDVNRSHFRFTVPETGQVRYGLGAIKGAGEAALQGIVAEREANGPFRDLFDFCQRIDTRKANKRVLEALVKAGALDCLGLNRASLLATLPRALQLAEQAAAGVAAGQTDLFGLSEGPAEAPQVAAHSVPDWPRHELLSQEKSVLGLYLSGHPIEDFRELIDQVCGFDLKRAIERYGGDEGYGRRNRATLLVGGWLADIRNISGDRPGRILTLDDRTAQLICWLDFDTWQRYQSILKKDTLIFVSGELSLRQREGQQPEHRLHPRSFMDLDTIRKNRVKRLLLTWRESVVDGQTLSREMQQLSCDEGVPVQLDYLNGRARATLDLGAESRLRPDEATLAKLRTLLGEDAVRICYRRWKVRQPGA